MTFTVWVIAARWLHVLAVSLLFGAALFPFYGVGTSAAISDRRLCELQRLLRASAILALVSGGFLFFFSSLPHLLFFVFFFADCPPPRVGLFLLSLYASPRRPH